jgi:hypothetical protein
MSRSAAALLMVLSTLLVLSGESPGRRLIEDLDRRELEIVQEG